MIRVFIRDSIALASLLFVIGVVVLFAEAMWGGI